ncbi:MAG: PQQ-binding-like beta-propeller repeat protein [Planctomycetaceae bacterium]
MRMDRTIFHLRCLAGIVIVAAALPAFGQIQIAVPGAPSSGAPGLRGGNLFTPSREKTRALRQAREFIKGENYADALRILQALIDSDNDAFFFEDVERRNKFLSLKAESMRLIETLPVKGRNVYELKYGLKAQTMLEDALEKGDFAGIEAVARRFFHTPAGYRATYLLATQQLDNGIPLSAALHFERLRKLKAAGARQQFEPMLSLQTAVCWGRAGLPKAAVKTLVELKQFLGGRAIKVGGRNVAMFGRPEHALTWLAKVLGNQRGFAGIGQEQWVMFRGNPARSAHSSPASPVWDAKWSVDTVRDTDSDRTAVNAVADEIQTFSRRRRKEGLLMQPAAHPLLVGDLAIFRTLERVWAVNVRSGAIIWKGIVRDRTYQKLSGMSDAPATPNVVNRRRNYSNQAVNLTKMQMLLDQRLWRDLTAGTLSSDGELVFSVDSLDYHDRNVRYVNIGGRVRPQIGMRDFNTLTLYDAKTGTLAGQFGGKSGGTGSDAKLTGHFFLGAPLPLGDQLFVLAEYRGEIRLLAIKLRKHRLNNGRLVADPKLLWVQTLITPNEGVSRFPLRRMAGLSPSYAGGILLCPTTSGAIVAVDPARRLLLWGYRYPTNTEGGNDGRNGMFRRSYELPTNRYDAESRWLDAGITVAGSRIILTPRDSNELHCVDVNGELVWKQPRGQRLYVGAVHDGRLIVVGKSQIEAIDLNDGSPAWKQSTPLPLPSGRGFQTNDYYHVPLESGEIATIDLKSGRILARTKTRSGLVPGNLVSANGLIVAQSVDRVIGFKPLDILQTEIDAKLKSNPEDGVALAMRGEIRLRNGDEEGGLADLRAAVAAGGPDRAKSLIASNLLEGLRLDFAGFRKYRPELEKILTDDDQRGRYHRLLAAGLHEVGELRDAFRQYLKLAGPNTGPWKQEQVGDVTVRGDRWLQSRIVDVFRKANESERKRLIAEMHQQLEQAVKFDGPKGLRRFSLAFGELPGTEKARRMLAERLDPQEDALELEFVLLRLRLSRNLETAAYATARLAHLLAGNGHHVPAAGFVADLEDRFGKIDCLKGKTGTEIAAELKKQRPQLTTALTARSPWPEKRIVAETTRSSTRRSYGRTFSAEFVGERGFYREWTFNLTSNARKIEARDGRGVVRWTLPFSGRTSSYYYYNTTVQAHGHLLVITMADRFMVVNALGAAPDRAPKILWQRNLYQAALGQRQNRGVIARRMIRVGGRMKWIITDPYGNPLGTVGHVGNRAIVFQSGRTLFAADPQTGDVLWKRGSVDRGSRLFGDGEHLFVAGPDATTALVLRATDGKAVATRPVASKAARKLTRGRFELVWRLSGNKYVLSWVDILNKKTVWRKQFSESAKVVTVNGDEAAVVEPKKGRFHVVGLTDGKTRVDSPIESDTALGHFLVRRSKDRYVLITYSTAKKNGKIFNVNGVNYYSPLANGYVYGFDRKSGKKIWTTYVADQSVEIEQPESMPVLIFAARRYENVQQRGVIRRYYKLAITILDTRNGRIVLDYSGVENTSPYQLNIDPVRKRIEVKFYQTQVALTMADKPMGKPSNRVFAPKGEEETSTEKRPPGKQALPQIRIQNALPRVRRRR